MTTFVGLQSPEVLPKHDVCLTVLGMLGRREGKRGVRGRRERGGEECGKGEGGGWEEGEERK